MTTKEMIAWFEKYKGYRLSTMAKDAVQRRIVSYLCNDIGYSILSGDEVRRIKAKTALTEFCQFNDLPYPT